MEVTLRINGSFTIANPVITSTGPGIVEALESNNPDEYKYKMTAEGVYYFTAQVTGPDGNVYQDTKAATVLPLAQVDALLRAKWAMVNSALQNGDIPTALTQMHPATRTHYQEVFDLLRDQWPSIISKFTSFTLIQIRDDRAIYKLNVFRDGNIYAHQIDFTKDETGLWFITIF